MRVCYLHAPIERRTGGPDPSRPAPGKIHKATGFLSNTGSDPLKNNKPAFNSGSSSMLVHATLRDQTITLDLYFQLNHLNCVCCLINFRDCQVFLEYIAACL